MREQDVYNKCMHFLDPACGTYWFAGLRHLNKLLRVMPTQLNTYVWFYQGNNLLRKSSIDCKMFKYMIKIDSITIGVNNLV